VRAKKAGSVWFTRSGLLPAPSLTPSRLHTAANDLADYAEVDILEEEDISESGAAKFNLEWMQKVVYTIKPALEQ